MKRAIGIDLGATKAAIGLVDSSGNVLEKISIPTGKVKKAPEIIEDILHALQPMVLKQKISGIGIGIAGQINPQTGIVIDAPNLDWHDFPIVKAISQKLQIPVHITNDVRAATLAEWLYGDGKGCKHLVCVFIGTGIGGGIVADGKLQQGSSYTFGEIGHMSVNFHGPRCACGNIGCVEAFAGGASLANRAKDEISVNAQYGKILLQKVGQDVQKITAKTLVEGYRENENLSKKILDQAILALTTASINLVNVLNPEKLLFSGGVVLGFPEMLDPIEKGVRQYALPAAVKHLKIGQCKLKNDAGIIGSAALSF